MAFSASVRAVLEAVDNALEIDSFGQLAEACDTYQRALQELGKILESETDGQAKVHEVLFRALEKRRAVLQDDGGRTEPISRSDVRRVREEYAGILCGSLDSFSCLDDKERPGSPLSFRGLRLDNSTKGDEIAQLSLDGSTSEHSDGVQCRLLGVPSSGLPGDYLRIEVVKMGFKDPLSYLKPQISISVRDSRGNCLEEPQTTPVATGRDETHVMFGVSAVLQTPIRDLPEDAAIFFEFVHFKPKKGRTSTRAWCMLEIDEVKNGDLALEIYRKPADFRRKKIRLLSVKPLYLHLSLHIHHS